jgi:hypothetical protein
MSHSRGSRRLTGGVLSRISSPWTSTFIKTQVTMPATLDEELCAAATQAGVALLRRAQRRYLGSPRDCPWFRDGALWAIG